MFIYQIKNYLTMQILFWQCKFSWCRVESKGNPRWLNRPFPLMFFKSLYSFIILWHANFTLMNVPVMKAIQYSFFFSFSFFLFLWKIIAANIRIIKPNVISFIVRWRSLVAQIDTLVEYILLCHKQLVFFFFFLSFSFCESIFNWKKLDLSCLILKARICVKNTSLFRPPNKINYG